MPSFVTALIVAFEFLLILAGAVLLWRLALSPAARAARISPPLPKWEIPFSGFLLFLWCVVLGGMIGQYVAMQVLQRLSQANSDTRVVIASAGFQLGLLAGCWFFRRLPTGRAAQGSWTPLPVPPLLAGFVTFLIALPLVLTVGQAWQYILEAIGLPVDSQDLIALFAQAESPAVLAVLVVFATVVAPITEELIFRGGVFRFARERLPRWAALVLPACLFAGLHLHLASFAPLVVLGILLSIAYERTGNILVPIVTHSLFNLNTVLLLLAGVEA